MNFKFFKIFYHIVNTFISIKAFRIFTPGHTPGHQSVLVNLPKTGHMLFTGDACYTGDHWCDKCLPGLVTSSSDAAESVHGVILMVMEVEIITVSLDHCIRLFDLPTDILHCLELFNG